MTIKEIYRGVIVPMVTPVTIAHRIDREAVGRITHHIVKGGCHPFVAGTTGEAASLSDAQKAVLVGEAVDAAAGKAVVYAGIADNCYSGSVAKAREYASLGADVVVAHLPCYYPIEEEQMRVWYQRLADESPLPVMLYNIPVTTGLSMPLSLVDELSHHENIVGFKDSERGDERLDMAIGLWKDRQDFTFHLGWAAKTAYGLMRGMDGTVPSTGNLTPDLYRAIVDAAKAGDEAEALRLQAIADEISAYYQYGRPLAQSVPVFKAMMKAFGLCEVHTLLPMLELDGEAVTNVAQEVAARFGQYIDI